MGSVYSSDEGATADELARAWAERVAGNREQAERVREESDGGDHYRPIAGAFRADPRRTDDPALNALLEIAQPDDVWLDVGAGAGRFALPLALRVRRVIAVEPSAGMRQELAESQIEHGVTNVEVRDQRWPSDDPALTNLADRALISHVAYDIEPISGFVDTLERAGSRECVAFLFDHAPGNMFWQLWPDIHDEELVPLPGGREYTALLRARGAEPVVEPVDRDPDRQRFLFAAPEDAVGWARRRLWLADDSVKLSALERAVRDLLIETEGGWTLPDRPEQLMIRWSTT